MRFKYLFLGLILSLFLTSCGSGIKKILSVGSINQSGFKKTIPFEYTKTGHILLKVLIKGKSYSFILDTGAVNVISKELAEELDTEILGDSEILDINDKKSTLDFVSIEEINIGGIKFENTLGSILDLRKGDLACLGVDGFIGSNLMRHAVWDFDFKNKTITITDDENKLNIPLNHSKTKMYIGYDYSASIITKLNEKRTLNCVIDLGNSGTPKLNYKSFKNQKKSKLITEYIKGSGGSGFGAFGRSIEKTDTYHARVNSFKIGDSEIKDFIFEVKDGNNNLGLPVFENYRIIFNWAKKSFKMIEQEKKESNSFSGFGFSPVYENNKLYVDYLFNNTKASKVLKYRDIILSVNEKDYSLINSEEWCEIIQNGLHKKDTKNIKVKVLRDGKELTFDLNKVTLL